MHDIKRAVISSKLRNNGDVIEITIKNLKLFKRIASKYQIDFAIKKDPKNKGAYYVFFKAKDAEVLETAFGEFSDKALNAKATVKEQIEHSKEIANEVNQERHQQNKDITKEKVKNNELQH